MKAAATGTPRRSRRPAAAAAGALLALLGSPARGDAPPAPSASTGLCERLVAGRLSVGVRASAFRLEDTRRYGPDGSLDNGNLQGNFLGSLWGLDALRRPFPLPFLEYRLVSAFGVGAAYEQARAKTLDWGDAEQTTTAGDGDLEIRGVQSYVFARGPRRGRLRPYAQIGLEFYRAYFAASPDWAIPGRHFDAYSTHGWFAALGGRVSLASHLQLDAQLRHSQTDAVQARAYLLGNHYRAGAFPMRRDAFALGLLWAF